MPQAWKASSFKGTRPGPVVLPPCPTKVYWPVKSRTVVISRLSVDYQGPSDGAASVLGVEFELQLKAAERTEPGPSVPTRASEQREFAAGVPRRLDVSPG